MNDPHGTAAPITLEIHDRPYGDDLLRIHEGLNAFNHEQMPSLRYEPWAFILRDDDGAVRGGIYGVTYTGCALIVLIWVDPALRGRGLGRALIECAQAHTARNGATFTFGEVMDFQAAAFFERMGYLPFGRLEGFHGGAARLSLRMENQPSQAAERAEVAGRSVLPLRLERQPVPAIADIAVLRDGVHAEGAAAGFAHGDQMIVVAARDASGVVVGGLTGSTLWGVLHVDNLWVSEGARGAKLGTRLLAAAEQEALARGCRTVYLETTSFQARPFYEKQGYTVFWTMTPMPGQMDVYGLYKRLEPSHAAGDHGMRA